MDFKGLAIEKIKKNNSEWKSHPVLRLDLSSSEYTKKEHLEEILNNHSGITEEEF